MAQVRSFDEMKGFLKSESYYENQILWATFKGDTERANYYLTALQALKKAHKDYLTGELELDELPHLANQTPKVEDPLGMLLLTLSMLAGHSIEVRLFDPSDHYSI